MSAAGAAPSPATSASASAVSASVSAATPPASPSASVAAPVPAPEPSATPPPTAPASPTTPTTPTSGMPVTLTPAKTAPLLPRLHVAHATLSPPGLASAGSFASEGSAISAMSGVSGASGVSSDYGGHVIGLPHSSASTSGASAAAPTEQPSVLSRLGALFADSSSAQAALAPGIPGADTDPSAETLMLDDAPPTPPPTDRRARREKEKERGAIKVLVVTWNMGDALPKGDLSVLLGDVPAYEPSIARDAVAGLPKLPIENVHPYHVVVFAAQECPTPSGVPRGLGGVMKGVVPKSDLRDRLDAEGLPLKLATQGLEKLEKLADGVLASPQRVVQSPTDERADEERTPALKPPSGLAPGPKGWSAMLEDWLCAGVRTNCALGAQSTLSTSVNASPRVNASPSTSSLPTPTTNTSTPIPSTPEQAIASASASTSGNGNTPAVLTDTPPVMTLSPLEMPEEGAPWHSATRTGTPPPVVPTKPVAIPSPVAQHILHPQAQTHPHPHPHPHTRSPLAHLALDPSPATLAPPSDRPEKHHGSRATSTSIARRGAGVGPYVNVAKERLMGLYLSVFVYRGCEHLVRGVDKDYVTAGLAGGRVGNKGGIGISLDLNGHRLLFVNAHLAAHTEKNDARLANIAKIKSELNLNCFLPADDPRAMFEDITDRFDTTFWCGDLNFRVDISLLHAKWLLEQQKYLQEALGFDQLRAAMADSSANPFPGFEEAPITFMPTFKYDVWKSSRATNRDIRRSLRKRRGTVDRHERPDVHSTTPGLQFVPEGDAEERPSTDTADRKRISGSAYSATEDEGRAPVREIRPRGSLDSEVPAINLPPECSPLDPLTYSAPIPVSSRSSMHGDASFGGSFTTADTERHSGEFSFRRMSLSRSPLASRASVAGSQGTSLFSSFGSSPQSPAPSKSHGFKERTKKLLGVMALGKRPVAPPKSPKMLTDRRVSISSARSTAPSEAASHASNISSEELTPPLCEEAIGCNDKERAYSAGSSDRCENMSVNGHTNGTNGAATARRSSIGQAKLLQSPPRRHLSLLRRPSSSSRGGAGTPLDGRGEYFFDLDEFDDTKDHRVGRYDTSKKQRIPSWCDRVLYRTHIIPDEDDDDAVTDDDASSRYRQAGPFHRLSHAFSNLGDHLLFRRRSGFDIGASPERSQRERDSEGQLSSSPIREFEPASADSMRSRRSLSASPELVLNSPRESVSVALNSPRRESAQGILGTRESTPGVVAVPVAVARDATSASDTTSATAATPADEQPQPRMPNSRSITFDAITTPARPRMGSDGAIAIAGATTAAAAESVGAGVAGSLPLESRMPTSPSSPLAPRRASSTDSTPSRRRASVGVATGGSIARRASASSRRGSVGPSLRRRLTDGAVANVPLAALTTVKSTGHSLADAQGGTPNGTGTNGTVTGPRKRRLSIDTRERRMSGAEPTGMNMFARFLRDLPGRLHSRVSLFHGTDATDDEPRRRLAGEVEVLYYGTIDDAGMRQLEGRSDHRPAIFAAAIHV